MNHICTFMRHFALLFFIASLCPSAWAAKVLGLRVGEHKDYTRIVLDMDKKPHFKTSLSKDHATIRLFMPKLQYTHKLPRLKKMIVKTISFTKFRTGVGEFSLKTEGPVKIIKAFTLPPSKNKRYFRYVLDIQKTKLKPVPQISKLKAKPKQKICKKIIMIDPGHGGKDPGATGRRGILEKNVTLSVAKTLQNTLNKTGKYVAKLTRNCDKFLKLSKRVALARQAKADLFISLHADSHPRSDTRGLSVYTLSKVASDKEAEKLAIKENKADLIDGLDLNTESPEVANILIDLMKRESMNLSRKLANSLVSKLRRRVLLLRNTIRSANFAVLRTPDLPAVLIEMGYISNKQDEKLLTTTYYRQKLCDGIREAVDHYFALQR